MSLHFAKPFLSNDLVTLYTLRFVWKHSKSEDYFLVCWPREPTLPQVNTQCTRPPGHASRCWMEFSGVNVVGLLCNLPPKKKKIATEASSVSPPITTTPSDFWWYSQISSFHLHPHSFSLTSCLSSKQMLMQNSPCMDPWWWINPVLWACRSHWNAKRTEHVFSANYVLRSTKLTDTNPRLS